MRARLAPGLLLAVAGAAFVLAGAGGDERAEHRFTVTVKSATNVVAGQSIRQAGVEVGRVRSIEPADGGRRARLELEVDDRAWPLPRGSRMALRWGGTANFGNRYIALTRGRGPGQAVQEGGTFPATAFAVPVELDQFLSAFPARSRAQLRRFLREAGPAMDTAREPLRDALQAAPPALEEASAVLQDLDADTRALRTLVRSADDVLGAVHTSEPGVRELLDGAAGTFDAIADETRGLQSALERAPRTLRTTRQTLAETDGTLARAKDVTTRVRPGIAEARRLARPLRSLLGIVREAGPDARATLATTRRAAPDLEALLARVGGLAPQLRSAGRQAVDNLECIRPFTPDIAAFFSNWGDFISLTDGKDKILRAQVQNLAPAPYNAVPFNSGQLAKIFTGLEYGFPRPPGYNAGQPWFLPECGAGPDALDPQKDPEIRPSAKTFDMPALRPIVRAPRERGR